MVDHLSHHINIATSVTNIKRLSIKEPIQWKKSIQSIGSISYIVVVGVICGGHRKKLRINHRSIESK
jgi:hypothetical protein